MIEYYLGEEPILANVETFTPRRSPRCATWALDRLDQLVWKPVDGSGGYGHRDRPARRATRRSTTLRVAVDAEPAGVDRAAAGRAVDRADVRRRRGWAPRHLDLRPFAVNDGENVWVVPGGLTRVALREGSLVVNSSQGGGSKDTWVLAPEGADVEPDEEPTRADGDRRREPLAAPAVRHGPAAHEQAAHQQQQQQQQ